jgi:hypothetical protein
MPMKRMVFFVVLLAWSTASWAASPWSGVWVQRDSKLKSGFTMTLEEVGSGWKITYRIAGKTARGAAVSSVMTIQTALDGTEAPTLVDGKPSGQTMAIRKIDSHHTYTVVKFQGKQTGISKSELLPDGKVIKSENENTVSGPNGVAGKQVQYWDKQ